MRFMTTAITTGTLACSLQTLLFVCYGSRSVLSGSVVTWSCRFSFWRLFSIGTESIFSVFSFTYSIILIFIWKSGIRKTEISSLHPWGWPACSYGSGEQREGIFLFQRFSICIQCYNAIAFRGAFTDVTEDEAWFFKHSTTAPSKFF